MSTMPIVRRGRFCESSEQPTPSNQELKCAAALPIQSCWGRPEAEPVSISKRASSPGGWSEESEGPASTRAESESSAPKVSMQTSFAESSDDDQRQGSGISIARTASHLSGSKTWESDDDKWSSEEELDAESCDSFCSALDTAVDDLDDLMPAQKVQDIQDSVFSINLLLKIRGAMVFQKDAASTHKYGGLRTAPCPTEKVSSISSPSAESPKSFLTSSSSPTAWKPSRAQGPGSDQDNNQQVGRAARSILNKLTVEKFDALYEQLAECGLKTPEHVKILMREIFEKATAQHNFIPMYADLCVRLEPDARVSAALGKPEQQAQSFKRLLLNQCQASFEELLVPDPDPVVPKTEEEAVEAEEARIRTKQRKLGNVKFVGELLLRGILQPQLLCTCIEDLLECWQDCSEAIESLAALLTVAGPKFDTDKEWSHRHRLAGLFDQLSKLVEGRLLAPRQRFLLKDVLDLRASGWSGCGQSGPKRLMEVRKEAAPAEKVIERAGASAAGLAAAFSTPTAAAAPGKSSPKATEAGCRTPLQLKPAESNRTPLSKSQAQRPVPPPFFPSAKDSKAAATASPSNSSPFGVKKDDRISALNRLSAICQAGSASCTAGRSSLFDVASFHKVLSAVLRQLRTDKNTFAAVRAVRAEQVPKQFQAREFADLITRVSEDSQGPARRTAWAFIMALCSSEEIAFEKEECVKGARTFFQEVYPELRAEVPRLSKILGQELLPLLRKSWGAAEVDAIVPQDILAASAS